MAADVTSYRVEIELLAQQSGANTDLEAFVDGMTDELMDLEDVDDRVRDVDVSAVLARGRIIVEMIVDATSADGALGYAEATVRCAGHAAGANTPGWDVLLTGSKEMAAA